MIDQESDILFDAYEELQEISPALAKQLHQMWESKMKGNMLNRPDSFEYMEVRAKDLKKGMEIINLGVVESVTMHGLHVNIHLHSPITNVNKVVVTRLKSLKVRVQ
ncbi:hypothetical protein [Catalinimonas niigatensis]|uniref:hypothetical protein n=1 Tax=Catalinimonas niigatensis TaxID=1397264 RepID=UPI002666CA64|nr:hypothetical protein [Catalinimonas niigatensis]WPP48353.1 hypothetical protein PZB72_16900 [Catalinimonas niigatensis]